MPHDATKTFLTCEQARLAIVLDLRTYGVQAELAAAVLRALAAPDTDPPPTPPAGPESMHRAVSRIETLLEDLRPPPDHLARLCALVFDQNAAPAPDPDGGPDGVLLDTGMEHFACTRCGRCCLDLDIHLDCSEADVALWRDKGRDDILAWVGIENGPTGPEYRIWKRPGTPLYAEHCPFLRRIPGDTAFVCAIHDVKPSVCRAYPGLRKHALLTGCHGFPRD